MKHKTSLFAHELMKRWVVNYWETFFPVVNCIIVRSLLAIASIHELKNRPIYFVISFTQSDIDVDVFMYLLIVMGVH